eukprot:353516-Chlamydomonas_euryale.AAC.10
MVWNAGLLTRRQEDCVQHIVHGAHKREALLRRARYSALVEWHPVTVAIARDARHLRGARNSRLYAIHI